MNPMKKGSVYDMPPLIPPCDQESEVILSATIIESINQLRIYHLDENVPTFVGVTGVSSGEQLIDLLERYLNLRNREPKPE